MIMQGCVISCGTVVFFKKSRNLSRSLLTNNNLYCAALDKLFSTLKTRDTIFPRKFGSKPKYPTNQMIFPIKVKETNFLTDNNFKVSWCKIALER